MSASGWNEEIRYVSDRRPVEVREGLYCCCKPDSYLEIPTPAKLWRAALAGRRHSEKTDWKCPTQSDMPLMLSALVGILWSGLKAATLWFDEKIDGYMQRSPATGKLLQLPLNIKASETDAWNTKARIALAAVPPIIRWHSGHCILYYSVKGR